MATGPEAFDPAHTVQLSHPVIWSMSLFTIADAGGVGKPPEGVGEGDAVGVGVGEEDGVGDADGVGDGDGVGVGVGLLVATVNETLC